MVDLQKKIKCRIDECNMIAQNANASIIKITSNGLPIPNADLPEFNRSTELYNYHTRLIQELEKLLK